MEPSSMIIGAVAGVALGAALGYALFTRILKAQASNVIAKAEQKGENIKDKKILQAKEKFIQLKEKHNAELKERAAKTQSREDKVRNELNNLQKNQDRVKTRNVTSTKKERS